MTNTAEKLSEYQRAIHQDLESLFDYSQGTNEMRYVITRSWTDRIKGVVASWGPDKKFKDGGYNFYRILYPPLNSLTPEELERRLCVVADIANKQGRLRAYRKTRSELTSRQNNQILASIFEITILSRLLELSELSGNIELFPRVAETRQDVEAAITLNNRTVYVEAKAIGYSRYDPKGPRGTQSIKSMKRQVHEAMSDKLSENKQLALLSKSHPTILCLALGFHADAISAGWAINDFLEDGTQDVSLVLLLGSAFCRTVRVFSNKGTAHQLTEEETQLLARLGENLLDDEY